MNTIHYASPVRVLRDRIVALIPANPQIRTMGSAWDLFAVPGFACADLAPTLAEAMVALRAAQAGD